MQSIPLLLYNIAVSTVCVGVYEGNLFRLTVGLLYDFISPSENGSQEKKQKEQKKIYTIQS